MTKIMPSEVVTDLAPTYLVVKNCCRRAASY